MNPSTDQVCPERAQLLGFEIDRLTMAETVARCAHLVDSGQPARQISLNAAIAIAARRDPRLASIIRGSDLISADGQPIVWLSGLVGDRLPERVAGYDLMLELLRVAGQKNYRVFLL